MTIARNAAVLGDGGGKETGPPTRGVRPLEGVRPVRPKEVEVSKLVMGIRACCCCCCGCCGCCGPGSIAGERGPERREPARSDHE